jgi:hypothetical protein
VREISQQYIMYCVVYSMLESVMLSSKSINNKLDVYFSDRDWSNQISKQQVLYSFLTSIYVFVYLFWWNHKWPMWAGFTVVTLTCGVSGFQFLHVHVFSVLFSCHLLTYTIRCKLKKNQDSGQRYLYWFILISL